MQTYIHSKNEKNKYEARLLTPAYYKGFEPVYNDFEQRAFESYKFELAPLNFEDFIDSVEKKLIECIVLFEHSVPVGFLVYTTAISESIELNIIHSFKDEDMIDRGIYLLKKFLELTKAQRTDKIVCYPMLGVQDEYVNYIAGYGFKFVGTVVLRFLMSGTNSKDILNMTDFGDIEQNYILTEWNDGYFNDAVETVQEAFENSADALFDTRFKTIDGTKDIIMKIVKNIYAEFLPEITTVLLYKNEPVGFCFVNLTDSKFANIPIFAIKKEHQGKGLSKYMLKNSLEKLIKLADSGIKPISEINTTTETDNSQALKMYRNLGFKEDYNYPQAYLPIKTIDN